RLASDPSLQERIRGPMMNEARHVFNWERWVDQWEHSLAGRESPRIITQFAFQHKYMLGRTLNVGCDADFSELGKRGAINLDVTDRSPVTKQPNAAHVLHDAREPLLASLGRFDTIIIGDLLEHLTPADGVRVLRNAREALKLGGRVIVTCPDDPGRDVK